MVSKALRRKWAPLTMVILPSLLLICVSQVQNAQFSGVANALQSADCRSTSLQAKAKPEDSWQAAHKLLAACAEDLAKVTGAPVNATLGVLKLQQCPGYGN